MICEGECIVSGAAPKQRQRTYDVVSRATVAAEDPVHPHLGSAGYAAEAEPIRLRRDDARHVRSMVRAVGVRVVILDCFGVVRRAIGVADKVVAEGDEAAGAEAGLVGGSVVEDRVEVVHARIDDTDL